MYKDLKIIDKKIKKNVTNFGWTMKFFLNKLNISEQGYSYMIKKNTLKLKTLFEISEVLEVPVGYFFNDAEFSVGSGSDVSLQVLQKENEGLKKEIELKNEIIELLKNK